MQWQDLEDEALLELPISDLGLSLEQSTLIPLIERFKEEMQSSGLTFRPAIYLGDEWFSPDQVNAISVPFYLAHPRLKRLEKNIIQDVEGGEIPAFMKLIRHEAGHCFDHSYQVSRRKKWRTLFGKPTMEYRPDLYRPRPYSRSFVQNLPNWYAQAHPDEDFAETFAVWLDPESRWQERYARWPRALEKLYYVETLAEEFRGERSKVKRTPQPYSAKSLKKTLREYYSDRLKELGEEHPHFYDQDLERIFAKGGSLSAGRYLSKMRGCMVSSVTLWTGERKIIVDRLMGRLIKRVRELKLTASPEQSMEVELTAYITTLVNHYRFTGRFRRNV